MAVVVKNIYNPLHDFQYKLMALGRRDSLILDTEEQICHLAFSNYDTITNISPRAWGGFPDCVGIIDSLSFHWAADKNMAPRYDSYRFITTSGPHKVYLTYDKPKLDPVHTLALDKICRYSQGENIDTLIAERGVMGVYGEGYDYNPYIEPSFGDPLHVIRHKTGQCIDYANLMGNLYRSIGLDSKETIINNTVWMMGITYNLLWRYTELPDSSYTCLITDKLRACDGEYKNWDFYFHAICSYRNYLCDPTLGLFENRSDYDRWWRYYLYPQSLTPPYYHHEPPPFAPTYNDINYPITPDNIFPHNYILYYANFKHP